MNIVYTWREALLGGPGLDGYAYDATLYCPDCGQGVIIELYRAANADRLPVEDLPMPIFFGESDRPQCCDACGKYLYG